MLPNNKEAELYLLSCLMYDDNIIHTIGAHNLPPEAFYYFQYREIYTSIKNLSESNTGIDTTTIYAELKKRNLPEVASVAELLEISEKAITTIQWKVHLKAVLDAYKKRQTIEAAKQIIESAQSREPAETVIRVAESKIFELSEYNETSDDLVHIKDVVGKVTDYAIAKRNNPEKTNFTSTGFKNLNKTISGLAPQEIYVIAARPAMGKSAFVKDLCLKVARQNKPVLLFNMEMSNEQTVTRMLSTKSAIDSQDIRDGYFRKEDDQALHFAAGELAKLPIYMQDSFKISVPFMQSQGRRFKQRHGQIGMVVLDYLQLLEGKTNKNGNRQQEVSEISRGLKLMAKELDCPVVALSQLSRSCEMRTDKRPIPSDIRESGAIEQDASVIMFLYRQEYYDKDETDPALKGVTELIISKNRFGACKTLYYHFDARLTSFREIYK